MKAKLSEIKEEYGREQEPRPIMPVGSYFHEDDLDSMMQRAYEAGKKEGWNDALELAAEKGKVRKMQLGKWYELSNMPENPYEIDKESILSLKLKD